MLFSARGRDPAGEALDPIRSRTEPPSSTDGDSICPKLGSGKEIRKGRRKQVTQVSLSYLLPQVVIRVELLI